MEARLTAVERSIIRIDATLPTLATKDELHRGFADVQKGFNDLIKWIVGTAIAIAIGGITIMTFVLNNAVPKAPSAPAAQQAPIIINVPGAAAPAPAVKASGP